MIIYYIIIYNKCLTWVSDLSCPWATVCCGSIRRHIVITLNTRIKITITTDYWLIKKIQLSLTAGLWIGRLLPRRLVSIHWLRDGTVILTREWQAALSKGFCAFGNYISLRRKTFFDHSFSLAEY